MMMKRMIADAAEPHTPFTRYSRLFGRLFNRFDNRLYRVNGISEFAVSWSLKVISEMDGC